MDSQRRLEREAFIDWVQGDRQENVMEIWRFDEGIDRIRRSLLSTMGKQSRLKRVLTGLTVKRSWFLIY